MSKPSGTIPYLSKTLVRVRKAELNRLHKIYSWRKIAHEIYDDEIKFGTLERFATDKNYIPKDIKLLTILGVMMTPSPYRGLPKWFQRTQAALDFFNGKRAQIKQMSNEAKSQRVMK